MVQVSSHSSPASSLPSSLASLPATVPDQTEVLDLSSSSSARRDQTAPAPAAPVPAPVYTGVSGVNTTPAHSRRDRDHDTSSPLSLVGALRRLGTNVNLVPVNFSMTRSRSQSPGSPVTVSRSDADHRSVTRSHGHPRSSSSVVTVSQRYSSSSRSHRDRSDRADRSVPSSSQRHSRSSSSAVIERLGLAVVPSSSNTRPQAEAQHGVSMPLAEATRLLNNTWDQESVRQADLFINNLASASSSSSSMSLTTTTSSFTRQHSSPAAASEYYNPAAPTDDSTDSSDSQAANNS